ncbi:S9 family peptidase [Chitinophaga sp. S165]|uniref:alpha/beta hydrolase family protein n=1 Tax=Chitinophaga sp. S165 TaxID=2135462 RepID=UPI000D71465E|nr:prolyl oligopeptidase family serine peptidase [Chitinophaga sp. S165]PWV45798.1 dipeptidyl aminopeptidase/acylaminoacyl peptidase [Chitinophaga sp. S165]
MLNKAIFYILIVLQVVTSLTVSAQNKPLDEYALKSWPILEFPSIRDDGKYVSFTLKNVPTKSQTLVIQSVNGKWQKEIVEGNMFSFLGCSKFAVFAVNDSVFVAELGTERIEYLPDLTLIFVDSKDLVWIGHNINKGRREFVLESMGGTKKITFPNLHCVRRLETDDNDSIKLLQMEDSVGQTLLYTVNLENGRTRVVWKGKSLVDFVVDNQQRQVVFSGMSIEDGNKKIWYYKLDSSQCKLVLGDIDLGRGEIYNIDRINDFSLDGSRIFIRLKKIISNKKENIDPQLSIWTFKDPILLRPNVSLVNEELISLNLDNGKVIRLIAHDGSTLALPESGNGDWAIETYKTINETGKSEKKSDLVSTINGDRMELENDGVLSPNGQYIVCFDNKNGYYYSINIESKRRTNMTESISSFWTKKYNDDYDALQPMRRGIAGWTDQGDVLIYDQFDIWRCNLNSVFSPQNITNGYGRKNGVVFSLFGDAYQNKFINANGKIILSAFDKVTKKNGFYSISFGRSKQPKLLTMQSKLFYYPHATLGIERGFMPLRAKDADIYIIQRMGANESPNYFLSDDFKNFKRLTNIHPETEYNWLTTELHTWNNFQQKRLQGVLYKPQDFDSTKKYPIIFYYYRKLSDNLNAFLKPSFSDGRLNIPWYVSKGFLVFTPDIHYMAGKPGESCLDAIVSATDYLREFSYIDSNKMGIQGISFGGFETNYLVTHTNIFAAACSSSGLSNFISGYNSINNGNIKQPEFEMGPYQMGGTLWEKRDEFINNSAVFSANKVTTPLLLMHTKNDSTVPYANALEFFLALRRLGKKVWFLSYENSDHGVYGRNGEDFNTRMEQFFNYLLKDSLPPVWMKMN